MPGPSKKLNAPQRLPLLHNNHNHSKCLASQVVSVGQAVEFLLECQKNTHILPTPVHRSLKLGLQPPEAR